jgi:hypothetical protein
MSFSKGSSFENKLLSFIRNLRWKKHPSEGNSFERKLLFCLKFEEI